LIRIAKIQVRPQHSGSVELDEGGEDRLVAPAQGRHDVVPGRYGGAEGLLGAHRVEV